MDAPRPAVAGRLDGMFPGVRTRRLAGDASTRVFHRLFLPENGTRVVMDYGAPFDDETDDVRLARIFSEAQLRVAAIEAVVPDPGFLVLEDLGDRTLEVALGGLTGPHAAGEAEVFYRKATDLAAGIAIRGTLSLRRSPRAGGPALDAARFRFEMDFFVEHYLRGLCAKTDLPQGLVETLYALADQAAASPRVLCHRDFHSRNLMVLKGGMLAMVDIQDARWGPDTYDLASLLRDAYVDLDDETVLEMVERYRQAFAGPAEPSAFRARFDVVSAERMIKALGTFGYQSHVLGRTRYLSAIPRTLARLARLLPAAPVPAGLVGGLERVGLFP